MSNILSIYSHNVSGAKSKMNRMNNILTMSLFDIIALQETWYDETVEDYELLRNTNYNLLRQDRRHTNHHKIGGGGVAILIKSELTFRQYLFEEVKLLQYLCISITRNNSTLLFINIYSPFGCMEESNADFITLLSLVERISRNETLILDHFNMSSVKWIQDDEIPSSFLPQGDANSVSFTEAIFDQNLSQIVPPPVGRNHLDIALVDDVTAFHVSSPTDEESLDRASIRHAPFVINYHVEKKVTDKIKDQKGTNFSSF